MQVITFLFGGLCHQLDDRCLVFDGRHLPICARCMGTLLGFLLALIVLRLIEPGRPDGRPAGWTLGLLGLLATLWAVDGLNSAAQQAWGRGLYQPSNALRLATGMGFGVGLGSLLYPIYQGTVWSHSDQRPVLARGWQVATLLAAAGALAALVLVWRTAPYGLWLLLVSAAVLICLATANAALVMLVLRRERRAVRWTQTLPWLALGACLALLELATMASLHALL